MKMYNVDVEVKWSIAVEADSKEAAIEAAKNSFEDTNGFRPTDEEVKEVHELEMVNQ